MLPLLGAALSFGGSLLSGLGARQSAKKQQKLAIALQAHQDQMNQMLQQGQNAQSAASGGVLQDMGRSLMDQARDYNPVQQANKYGFNPVTWLNSGVMGNYVTAALSAGASLFQRGNEMQVPGITPYGKAETVNIPSEMSAFGGALSAGLSTYTSMDQFDQTEATANRRNDLYAKSLLQAFRGGNPLAGVGTTARAGALSLGSKSRSSSKDETDVFGMKVGDAPTASYGYPGIPRSEDVSKEWGPVGAFIVNTTNDFRKGYREYQPNRNYDADKYINSPLYRGGDPNPTRDGYVPYSDWSWMSSPSPYINAIRPFFQSSPRASTGMTWGDYSLGAD